MHYLINYNLFVNYTSLVYRRLSNPVQIKNQYRPTLKFQKYRAGNHSDWRKTKCD